MHIHLVFYIPLKELAVDDSVIVDGEEEYKVEKILNSRIRGK